MISSEEEAHILRLFEAEGWKPATIARRVGHHRATVRHVLERKGVVRPQKTLRPRMLEPYLPWLRDLLRRHEGVAASLVFRMVRGRGYPGRNEAHFRQQLKVLRPPKVREAYQYIETLPGEEAQVDWVHCGHLQVGDAQRPLMGFVMTLSYSRRIFLRFFLSASSSAFYQGIAEAFAHFGGVPRRIIIDNLKSGVVERVGNIIRFREEFVSLGRHYNVELIAARPRTPTDKGKVERSIRYIRSSFPGLLAPKTLETLNAEALAWCVEEAATRRCPGEPNKTVAARFEAEKPCFLKLPSTPYDAHEILVLKVAKRPFVRFDGNEYSVPSQCVGNTVTLHVWEHRIVAESQGETIAEHQRAWGKGERISAEEHHRELRERKRMGQKGAVYAELVATIAGSETLLAKALVAGENVGSFVARLQKLRREVGNALLSEAVAATLSRGGATLHELLRELDALQLTRRAPPPVPVVLPVVHPMGAPLKEISSLEQYKLN